MNTDLLEELYTDYLISAFGYTTATGLSKMTGREVSHKITRFLSEKELDSSKLWRLVKLLVREFEDEASGVLIIELDTIEENPTPTRVSLSAGTTIIARAETSKA